MDGRTWTAGVGKQGAKENMLAGEGRNKMRPEKLHNEEHHKLHYSPITIRTKQRPMR